MFNKELSQLLVIILQTPEKHVLLLITSVNKAECIITKYHTL